MPTAVAGTVIGGLILVSLAISVLLLSAHGKVKSRQLELAQKQAELAAIPVPAQSRLQQQDALVADKSARVTALNAALSKRIAWDRVLREFALVLPDDVWLTSLSATAPSSATATAASATSSASSSSSSPSLGGQLGFSIDGYTYSHDAVARLLTRLAVVPDLQQVQLVSSEQAEVGKRTVIHFKISANVRAPGASS
ncbi:MAG TPA: PilN domain-containing protein [Gaiellaceae bacterium]|nr:PilN domain-containing protein [Gaiellaceae bacterium]